MANLSSQNVGAGNRLDLQPGNSAGPVDVYGKLIVNGGTASETTVYQGGNAAVMNGGLMNIVNVSGGLLNVLKDGQASNVTLTDDAAMYVVAGGIGKNVDVQDGTLHVSGTVSSVKIASGAGMQMDQNAIASAVTVTEGGKAGTFTQVAGTVAIATMKGNDLAGKVTGLNAEGNLTATTGASVQGGNFASGTFIVNGGAVTGLTVANEGLLKVASAGATVTKTVLSSGAAMSVNANASATEITLNNGAKLNDFTHVGENTATVAQVIGNAVKGAVTDVAFTGTMNTAAGATLKNITIHDGALLLAKGAKADDITVMNGSAYIQSGAVASDITVQNGGTIRFENHATAGNVTVATGGKLLDFVQAGSDEAVIETVTNSGFTGAISNLHVAGKADILAKGAVTTLTVSKDSEVTLHTSASATAAEIEKDGKITVKDAASINNVAIKEGAHLNVSAGGSATGITLDRNGFIDLTIRKGDTKTLITGQNEYGAFAYSNGVASDFVVYAGQKFVITSGGSARNIITAEGAIVSAAMGADVTGYSSDMRMNYSISGATISGLTNLTNFELEIGRGYAVNGQKLNQGGVQSVLSGGQVSGTYINNGGELRVGYNGSAMDVIQSAGGKLSMDVYHAAALTTITGSRFESGKIVEFELKNGTAKKFAISSGASMVIHSGGNVIDTTIEFGGKMVLSSGGSAQVKLNEGAVLSANIYGGDTQTTLSALKDYNGSQYTMEMKNGIASNFVLDNDSLLNVYSGGIAENVIVDDSLIQVDYKGTVNSATIADGGRAYVKSEGSISNVNIENGGELRLAAGAVLNGNVVVAGQLICEGNISFLGQSITINAAANTADNTVYIENIAMISGGTYSVIVNAAQQGDYKLASGAANFAGTISVYDNENKTYLGSLQGVGSSFQDGVYQYTLTENQGCLTLNVQNADIATFADITTVTNQNVTVTANFHEKFTVRQFSTDRGVVWQAYTGSIVMTENGTILFRGTTADGYDYDVTYSVTNIDKTAPDVPTTSSNTDSLTNQNVQVYASFSNDSVLRQYSYDGNVWLNYTDGVVMTENGTVYFRGQDAAGNISVTEYEVTNIDKVAPDKPVITADSTNTTAPTVTVNAQFSPDSVKKEFSYDGNVWEIYTNDIVMTENGTLYFRGTDNAGNISEVTEYTIKNISTSAITPANVTGTVKKYVLSLAWDKITVEKGKTVTYEITVNGETYTSKSNKFSLSNLLPGNYEYQVRGVISQKGEENLYTGWSDSVTAPVTDITKPKMGKVTVKQTGNENEPVSITVEWDAATDNNQNQISKYVITCNGQTKEVDGNTFSWTFSNVEGTKAAVTVVARDAAGLDSSAKKVNLTIKDMIDPGQVTGVEVVTVTDKYKGTFTWEPATDNFEKIAKYQVMIDGNTKYITSSKNSVNVSNLSVGWHTIQVRAVDKAKNEGAWSDAIGFEVKDMTAPKMGKVTAKQVVAHNEPTTITVEWAAATDNNQNQISKYVITCNGQTKEVDGNTFSWTFSNVEGTKAVITVTAYDMADDPIASAPKKVNLTIKDMIDPGQVTGVKVDPVTDKYKRTFTWEPATDNFEKIAKYQVMIDGKTKYISTSKNSVSISNLSVGEHTIRVRAFDKANNDGEWSEEFTFVVEDVTAPNTVSVKTKVTANDVQLTWKTPKDNADSIGQGVTEYSLRYGDAKDTTKDSWTPVDNLTDTSFTIKGLDKGKYKFEMIARDAAGNESKVKTGSFEIKTELPVMDVLMDYASNSTPDLMAWTSSESADSAMLYSAETEYDLLQNNDPVSGSDALCSFASGETENWYDPENRNAGNLAALA